MANAIYPSSYETLHQVGGPDVGAVSKSPGLAAADVANSGNNIVTARTYMIVTL